MHSKEQIIHNGTKLGISLLLITLPFSTRFNGLSIILLTFLFLIRGHYKNLLKYLLGNKVGLLMILFYCIYALGMLYSANKGAGEKILIKSLSIILFPFILAPWKKEFSDKDIYLFFKIFITACIGICTMQLLLLLDLNFWDHDPDNFVPGPGAPKSMMHAFVFHPTYMGLYLNFSIQILLFIIYKFGIKLPLVQRISIGFIILFFIFFIIQGFSRINIILLIITCTIYILIILRNNLSRLTLGFIIIGFLAVILGAIYLIPELRDKLFFQLINFNLEYPNYHNGWNATNLRLAEWSCSFNTIKENLLLGVGTGDGQDALEACYKQIQFWNFSPPYFNSHNQYLQITLTNGLPGLILLLSVFISGLVASIRQKNIIYFGFLLSVMLVCVTESILMVQKGIVFFSIFNILFSYYGRNLKIIKDL